MQVKFSGDVIPLSDLKIDPAELISRAQKAHRPILLTSRGRGIAVLQGIGEFEKTAEELRFVKATVHGLTDVIKGNTVSLDDAKQALGIK